MLGSLTQIRRVAHRLVCLRTKNTEGAPFRNGKELYKYVVVRTTRAIKYLPHKGPQISMCAAMWSLIRKYLAVVGLCALAFCVGSMFLSTWRPHIIRLLLRTFEAIVMASGTTRFAVVYWGIGLAVAVWLVSVADTYRKLKKDTVTQRPLREAIEQHSRQAKITTWTVILFSLFAYGYFFVEVIRTDHSGLVSQNAQMREANGHLVYDLNDRKRNIHVGDPAYEHIKVLFGAFILFRRAIGDKAPCEIKISAPTDSSGPSDPIIRQVADVAAMASGCGVFGPGDGRMDPDAEKEAVTGMKPGLIILHTRKDQAGSLAFYDTLAPYLPLTRSYDDMPATVNRGPTPAPILIWFQFSKDVNWVR
jgi:hypothetical protein